MSRKERFYTYFPTTESIQMYTSEFTFLPFY